VVPLKYEKVTAWEIFTKAIIEPRSDDGQLFWNTNFNKQVNQGYQYKLGNKFPY